MTAAKLRASYTFSASVLQRFNAVVPQGERRRVMEERRNRHWPPARQNWIMWLKISWPIRLSPNAVRTQTCGMPRWPMTSAA